MFVRCLLACAALAGLASCATLPEETAEVDDPALAGVLQNLLDAPAARLSLCTTEPGTRTCTRNRPGLRAEGLAGAAVPLFANFQEARLKDGVASFALRLNGVKAQCREARPSVDPAARTLRSGRFFCNWLGLGNVFATVEMTADWYAPEENAFGGRYRLQFNGTGNAAGTGTYRGVVAPDQTAAEQVSE